MVMNGVGLDFDLIIPVSLFQYILVHGCNIHGQGEGPTAARP